MIDPCSLPVHHWWQWHPPVGTFIGILGGLGIVVPWLFRPPETMGRSEKAIWALLMLLFVWMELRTLYLDRGEHDAEQAQARCQQLQSFQQIATTLGTAIKDSQTQFDQTMKKENGILDTTKSVGDKSQKILSEERELQRTDYQRVWETYNIAGQLGELSDHIRMEDPDNGDGTWGDYKAKWIEQKRAGNEIAAQKVLEQFEIVKKRRWEGWQKEVDRFLPEVRSHASELVKRLPENEVPPKPNVTAFLKSGILSRNREKDTLDLSDTADYLRKLAYDSTASAAALAGRP